MGCCQSDGDCPSTEACLSPPPVPFACVDIPPVTWFINQCSADQCHSDADCGAEPNGACTATFPRVCGYGPCRSNADCTQGRGGACVVEQLTIQGPSGPCLVPYVFCRYATDPCRTDADCGSPGKVCLPNGLAGARCVDNPRPH
jgi:hypothetical protein